MRMALSGFNPKRSTSLSPRCCAEPDQISEKPLPLLFRGRHEYTPFPLLSLTAFVATRFLPIPFSTFAYTHLHDVCNTIIERTCTCYFTPYSSRVRIQSLSYDTPIFGRLIMSLRRCHRRFFSSHEISSGISRDATVPGRSE